MMESTANYRTQPLSVYAPASVGNMSVGFDALGLALAPIDGTLLGDIVMLSPLPEGAEVFGPTDRVSRGDDGRVLVVLPARSGHRLLAFDSQTLRLELGDGLHRAHLGSAAERAGSERFGWAGA